MGLALLTWVFIQLSHIYQRLQHSLYGAMLDSVPTLFILTGVVVMLLSTCGVLSLHPLIYLSQQLNGTLSQERCKSQRISDSLSFSVGIWTQISDSKA